MYSGLHNECPIQRIFLVIPSGKEVPMHCIFVIRWFWNVNILRCPLPSILLKNLTGNNSDFSLINLQNPLIIYPRLRRKSSVGFVRSYMALLLMGGDRHFESSISLCSKQGVPALNFHSLGDKDAKIGKFGFLFFIFWGAGRSLQWWNVFTWVSGETYLKSRPHPLSPKWKCTMCKFSFEYWLLSRK